MNRLYRKLENNFIKVLRKVPEKTSYSVPEEEDGGEKEQSPKLTGEVTWSGSQPEGKWAATVGGKGTLAKDKAPTFQGKHPQKRDRRKGNIMLF